MNMKTNKMLFLVILGIFLSCEENECYNEEKLLLKGEIGSNYNESLNKWLELKKINGNSYIYQILVNSWTGFGSITELKIEEGIVVSRSYQKFKTNHTNGQREIIDSYTETKSDLGTHEKGAKPLTIDDQYNTCAREYLIVDEESNTLSFETENDGLMSLCGFSPKGCMDDCFTGVYISSFKWIN